MAKMWQLSGLLMLAAAAATAQQYAGCPEPYGVQTYPHETYCDKFYKCANGRTMFNIGRQAGMGGDPSTYCIHVLFTVYTVHSMVAPNNVKKSWKKGDKSSSQKVTK